MNNSEPTLNQTYFSGEQTFYQDPELSSAEIERRTQKELKKTPWHKQKKFLALIPVIFILLVILLAIIILKRPKPEPELELPPEQVVKEDTGYMIERIRRLQGELKQADPTKTDILFPPVDMAIELDPSEK